MTEARRIPVSPVRCLRDLQVRGDIDRAGQATRDRAEACVKAMHPLCVLAALVRDPQPVLHPDSLDHQDAILVFDLAGRLDFVEVRIDFDLTRFQRAGERASQSTTGGRDDVVQRGRVRRILRGVNAVVLGDLGMDAEHDRSLLAG
jgi:hypothetical protein